MLEALPSLAPPRLTRAVIGALLCAAANGCASLKTMTADFERKWDDPKSILAEMDATAAEKDARERRKKLEDEARKRGQDPNDGSAQFGGAIAGLFISNMPIERRNFLAFAERNGKIVGYGVHDNGGVQCKKSCFSSVVARVADRRRRI